MELENAIEFYVDTTDSNIIIEQFNEDLIIICENKA